MEFVKRDGDSLIVENLFNEEHAAELIATVPATFSEIRFNNVGVKVMRLILAYYEEAGLRKAVVNYNWNTIMTTPQLVCYDKNQWKTLQQLSNWNKEWSQLFLPCYALTSLELHFQCSWMDDQLVKQFLEGLLRLPNIQAAQLDFSSKNPAVGEVLSAFAQAKILGGFKHSFSLLK